MHAYVYVRTMCKGRNNKRSVGPAIHEIVERLSEKEDGVLQVILDLIGVHTMKVDIPTRISLWVALGIRNKQQSTEAERKLKHKNV